ncbi:MauE/DoxX family redox-associated membrane protein [Galbibacter sp. PAP.153]|uniref:MauE/DoxX family redox-associated membrane protein n=1 Tax=Galbibacter sp. PAP.153 TaxID=3104623 RepID=UPI00300A240E
MKYGETFIYGTRLFYVLLFVYASVSKFLDFQNFRIQLGQSPMIGEHADISSWPVPLPGIIITLFLMIPELRPVGVRPWENKPNNRK